MKLIIAYIQPHKINEVKQELYKNEIYKISVTNALGCGQQAGYSESYRGVDIEVNLLKKVRIEIAVNDKFVKPTIDGTFKRGQYSTISDHKDNVHWFKCKSDRGFIFNIHVLNIDPKIKKGGRVYIDPDGEKLSGERIKAPKMKATEAHNKYG